MKKRVRIYGAGGSNPFSMKTAAPWRAQEGGTQEQPQYTDEQLVSTVMTIIGEQGGSPEDALNQLVQAGVDQTKANQIVSSAVSYINDQAEMNNAEMSGQGYKANKLAEEDAALNQQAQDDQEEEARQQRYQQMMASNNEDTTDYGDDQDVVSEMIAKFGGAMPSKRSFVKNVMKLTKKQMGGDGTSNKADDTDTGERKGGLNDFITGLQSHANDALIKQDAEALYDQYQDLDNDMDYGYDIDQDYMQLGGMRPGQMRRMNRRANRMMGQIPAGMFNNRTQMFPSQMNIIGMPMMGPQGFVMPDQGSYQGGPRLANIDVRRTGLFGKPKEYTITFAQEAYTNPQLREDVIKQEQNNQKQKAKEIWTEVKEEVDNTATEKNAEVKAEAAKSPTTATSESVDAEVSASTGKPKTTGTTPAANSVDDVVEEESVESATIPETSSVVPKEEINFYNQYLPGKPQYRYLRENGKWFYQNVNSDDITYYPVTNKESLAQLNQGPMSGKGSKSGDLFTLPSKPGYYYRMTNAGDFVKFKGDPKKHSTTSKPITTIKKGDPNYDYLANNSEPTIDVQEALLAQKETPAKKGEKSNLQYYANSTNSGSVKKYAYNPTTKEWFREGSNTPVKDTKAIAQLNLWKKGTDKGAGYGFDLKLNSFDDKIAKANIKDYYKPVTGLDPAKEFLLTALMGNKLPGQFTFKGPAGLPSPGLPGMRGLNPGFQFGGMTMEDSNLYKFVYGGNDPITTPFEENTADPYFQIGGSKQKEYQDWYDRMYGESTEEGYSRQAPVSYEDWLKDYYPNEAVSDKNKEAYEKAKVAGINVGEYREGIRYEDLHKFPKMVNSGVNLPYNNPYIGNMYNPQIGAMHPPLFGRRQFGPAGRTIQYAGSWAQQQGMAFDPRTGQPVNPAMMGNQPLSKIDVTKTSLFGKRPKEYTMYFGNYGQFDTKDSKATDPNVENEDQMDQGSRKQKLADFLLRTPGLRQVGARMYPSSNFAPTEKTTVNNSSTSADQRANDIPTKGIRGFVNDQLNLNLNRQPRVAPKSEFGEYAPYNPDMINMQERYSFPDYYEFGKGKPNTTMAYGGYLPEAQMGVYTQNPNFVGLSDIDILDSATAPQVQGATNMTPDWTTPIVTDTPVRTGQENDPSMTIDPNQPNSQTVAKEQDPRGFAAKFKNKNMYNVDFERGLNQFNVAADWGMQKLGEIGQRGINRNFYDNLTGDNLYGSTNLEDRGTYDTNSGLFRPDQMGFKGIVRNGGFLQDGGYNEPMYNEDEEAYMTQDEIDQFLADGGELEYL